MNQNRPRGETDNCRWRLMRYCQGQGLDIGCGNTKIRMDAIGVDLYHPNGDVSLDARDLSKYPDNHFDYIYSSHLLEELENTEATLRGWLKIIKDGGYLVLYQADKDLYYPLGDPNCNRSHKHHFDWESLWNVFKTIGGVDLIHHGRYPERNEWSFELVVKKNVTGIKDEPIEPEGISFLIPSRNRPQGIETLSMSIDQNTADPRNIEIIFGIDDTDTASKSKIDELKTKLRLEIRYEIMKPWPDNKVHLSNLWNQCYKVSKYPIVGYFGDDVIFQTPGWDIEVRKEFAKDKVILLNCNDVHVQRGKQATLFFTHKISHEAIGYYLCERFRRWYSDTLMEHIFRYAGKFKYREDIVTEHLHPDAFPDRIDETYSRMESLKGNDHLQWNSAQTRSEVVKFGTLLKNIK